MIERPTANDIIQTESRLAIHTHAMASLNLHIEEQVLRAISIKHDLQGEFVIFRLLNLICLHSNEALFLY